MAIIYHLARRSEWEEAGDTGPYRAGSLAQEGFIHCSANEEQMLGVANRLFAGMEDVLVLNQSQGGNYILQRWQRQGRCKNQCIGSIL